MTTIEEFRRYRARLAALPPSRARAATMPKQSKPRTRDPIVTDPNTVTDLEAATAWCVHHWAKTGTLPSRTQCRRQFDRALADHALEVATGYAVSKMLGRPQSFEQLTMPSDSAEIMRMMRAAAKQDRST